MLKTILILLLAIGLSHQIPARRDVSEQGCFLISLNFVHAHKKRSLEYNYLSQNFSGKWSRDRYCRSTG